MFNNIGSSYRGGVSHGRKQYKNHHKGLHKPKTFWQSLLGWSKKDADRIATNIVNKLSPVRGKGK